MKTGIDTMQTDWEKDCIKWWGKVLTGKKSHWCYDWDFLPVDETTEEFSACTCFENSLDTAKESA